MQPGDFSSTTTVTGLPSTPSRNAIRQPQARRACVNPFNIASESYHAAEQRFDLALECLFRTHPGVLRADSSVARDQRGHRNAPQRSVCILHVVVIETLQHRVVHLELRGERGELVWRIVDGDADD